MNNQPTKRRRKVLRQAGLLLILVAMITSCASLASFFKGSGRKYDAALAEWEGGEYSEALRGMISVYKNDDNFTKAKVFVRDHYAEGVQNILGKIAKAQTMEDPKKKSKAVFDGYYGLYLLNEYLKKNIPIVGPKEEWSWEPEEIKDFSSQVASARKTAVDVYLNDAARLFAQKKGAEGRELVDDTIVNFIYITKNSPDEKRALYDASIPRIVRMVDGYAASVQGSSSLEELDEAREAIDLGLAHSEGNQQLTARRQAIENRIATLYVAQGREMEAEGGVAALKKARSHYQKGLRDVKDHAGLTQALNNVNRAIADAYYDEGYALEQKGDDESMKAAISKYEAGLEYAEGYEKLTGAIARTKNTVAERYYQEALAMEPDVGEDPQKAKEVVAVYEKAQAWVEDYKDSNARIAKIMAAVQVNIYVVANTGSYYDALQGVLEKALDRKVSEPYAIYGPEDSSGLLTAAQVDSNNFIAPAKTLGAKFVVVIKAETPNYTTSVRDNEESEEFYYAIDAENKFQKIDEAAYKLLKYQENTQGIEQTLRSQELREFGKGTKTVYTQTRTVNQEIKMNVAVYNIKTERRVYTQNISKTIRLARDTRHVKTDIPYRLRMHLSRNSDLPSRFPAVPSVNSTDWVNLLKKNDGSATTALSNLSSPIISQINAELSN